MVNKRPQLESLLEDLAYNHSEKALKAIFSAYSERIARYILMYVHSKVVTEELLSDVFYAVWENREKIPQINNFHSYIYSIAKFKALNYLRENQLQTIELDQLSIDLYSYTETTAEEEYISKEFITEINKAIEALPPKCKLAFKLVKEDQMKYKEVAEHLGVSIKTLESQITIALRKIKEKLQELNQK